jgi:hypothetical protein
MRALILVAGAALALSGCASTTHMTLGQELDLGCALAVLTSQTTSDVADVAREHGLDPTKADKIARKAAKGENVVRLICGVASSAMSM